MFPYFLKHSPKYQGIIGASDTNREPSPIIWNDFLGQGHGKSAAFVWDDFNGFGHRATTDDSLATTAIVDNIKLFSSDAGGWYGFCTKGATPCEIVGSGTLMGGVAVLSPHATDNGVAAMKLGTLAAAQCKITSASGLGLWYETRVRFSQIASDQGIFIGLAEAGLVSATGLLAADKTVQDKDFIGFVVRSTTPSTLEMLYNLETSSGGIQDEGDALTIVADTWYKLGMKFVPGPPADKLEWYVDGVLVDTTLAAAISGANFPSAIAMSPQYHTISTGTAFTVSVDWMSMACEI